MPVLDAMQTAARAKVGKTTYWIPRIYIKDFEKDFEFPLSDMPETTGSADRPVKPVQRECAIIDGKEIEFASAEDKFKRLAAEWKSDRGPQSNISRLSMNFAYQQIIGMGNAAIPFIIRELEQKSDHWFWALSAIAGVDPIPEKSKGVMAEMAHAWIAWYQKDENRRRS